MCLNTVTRGIAATLSLGVPGVAQLDNALAGGIVGAYATVGTMGAVEWATTAAASGQDREILALGSYTDLSSATATRHNSLAGSGALTGSLTTASLKLNSSGAGQSLTIGAG